MYKRFNFTQCVCVCDAQRSAAYKSAYLAKQRKGKTKQRTQRRNERRKKREEKNSAVTHFVMVQMKSNTQNCSFRSLYYT